MADTFQNNIPVSIRLNPFKLGETDETGILPIEESVPWSPYGRYLSERPSFTLDPLFHAGLYYVQDASAMLVGWMFRKVLEAGFACERVLDLCAAPGGKTTDISASLREVGDDYLLVSNEVIHARALALHDNVARWGDPNIVVTGSDPKDFGRLGSFFDIIVADVPCSGEGMFRKSENARQMWSEDNVQLCASRQRRIIADAWKSLKDGGVLIYSTCTLNDDENDDNVAWIVEDLGATVIRMDMPFDGPQPTKYGFLMVPGQVKGEGQYCAALFKGSADEFEAMALMDNPDPRPSASAPPTQSVGLSPCICPGVDRVRIYPSAPSLSVQMFTKNDEVYALPGFVADQMNHIGKRLNVLNAGVHAFTMKGRDRIPCEDLALSAILDPEDFPDVPLGRQDALRFLHKDAIVLKDAPLGYVTVSYEGHKLGFMKNLGNRANNLHPAGRRILMNIE